MTNWTQAKNTTEYQVLHDYYQENYSDWIYLMEELDSWNGYLDGERREPMDFIDDYFDGMSLRDILSRLDKYFDINDDYFYFDWNGDVCSTNEIDYEIDIYAMDVVLGEWNNLYIVDDFSEELTAMWKALEAKIYG